VGALPLGIARWLGYASAALSGSVGAAVGNILGGIAIQTVVLVVLDAFGVGPGRPLTYRAAFLACALAGAAREAGRSGASCRAFRTPRC
jgi:hypothetical protein